MTTEIRGANDGRVTIRVATVNDAALLATLGARLFEQTFGPDNTPDDMRAYLAKAFDDSVQRDELTNPRNVMWIAEDADRVAIGYALLRRGSHADGIAFARPAEVHRIYVDRAWHGRGVGHMLMDTCVSQARDWEADGIWLAVWERNPRAIAFYQRVGYSMVGMTTFTLGSDVQSDLVMARPLPSL